MIRWLLRGLALLFGFFLLARLVLHFPNLPLPTTAFGFGYDSFALLTAWIGYKLCVFGLFGHWARPKEKPVADPYS
jgi:hypothetical protein